MKVFGKGKLDRVLQYIEQANDTEIEEIMAAVEQRYAIAYPQWDVVYVAVHKDPMLRKKELEDLMAIIGRDIEWSKEKNGTGHL